MLTETFDRSEEIIRPEMIYGKRKKLCDICIITFSQHVIEYALQKYDCKKVISLESTGGSIPIYIMTYQEKELALYQSMIGAPAAGACLEEARCLTGASHYIMFGSCGCLHEEIPAGKLIVPTQAYRDEGLSYHYVPAGDYLPLPNAGRVASFFERKGIPFVTGKTWTTDGLYRETRANMSKRKAEGCLTVEMECAGLQAVCSFRELQYYAFLFGGDLLDAAEWDVRILGNHREKDCQIEGFRIALELAHALSMLFSLE